MVLFPIVIPKRAVGHPRYYMRQRTDFAINDKDEIGINSIH